MFRNYLQIALAVLKRRKFFTFLSLFGISFTLTIFILMSALIEHVTGSGYPDNRRDRELFVATMNQSSKNGYNMSGAPSLFFLNTYLTSLKTPEKTAIVSLPVNTIQYINNKKKKLNLRYTNDEFWDMLAFEFREGKAFTRQQLKNAEKVAVISEETSIDYFGEGAPAVGEYIEAGNNQYRVTGVVKTVPATQSMVAGDIYIPYTLSTADMHSTEPDGRYIGIVLARSSADFQAIRDEYNHLLARIPIKSKIYDHLESYADTYLGSIARSTLGDHSTGSGLGQFYLIVIILSLLFLLLPAINLVNINISRILERASEIGVRKSFGASSGTLALQFLVENLFLTAIGCVIGILVSTLIIYFINTNDVISNVRLNINLHVLGYSLLSFLVFGLLSGVYPAWRMSRLPIVSALKSSK